ncbi:hypothetical protein SLEP1_g20082 [Rubroshorea leprosula]|uniref:Uncharacterized protein n=1 Tax=Rubroshorea leprosula TaxID=152421 RepID=A0AAV5JC63_9ROSI|nr:hypothetical protein SLEP1_g20082 [Rubroshorea leprosula]
MIFPYFLVQEPDLEPRNLPRCRKLPDLLCPSSLVRRLLLIVGDFWAYFSSVSSPTTCCRPLLLPAAPVSTAGELCFRMKFEH